MASFMCILAQLKAIFKLSLKKKKTKAVSQVPMMPHHQASNPSSLLLERSKEKKRQWINLGKKPNGIVPGDKGTQGLNPKPDKNLASYTPEFSTYNFF